MFLSYLYFDLSDVPEKWWGKGDVGDGAGWGVTGPDVGCAVGGGVGCTVVGGG